MSWTKCGHVSASISGSDRVTSAYFHGSTAGNIMRLDPTGQIGWPVGGWRGQGQPEERADPSSPLVRALDSGIELPVRTKGLIGVLIIEQKKY